MLKSLCRMHFRSVASFGNNIKAFTLAEVLVTLGIIGIVSALTMPTIISNHQKKVTVESLKRAYNILSEAVGYSETENGKMEFWKYYKPNKPFSKYVLPYLRYSSYCENCKVPYKVKMLNGSDASYSVSALYNGSGQYQNIIVYLTNGMIIAGRDGWENYSATADENFKVPIIAITVDINGAKGPNRYGRDIFVFEVNSKYGVEYYGYRGELSTSSAWNRLPKYEDVNGSHAHACSKQGKWGYWCAAKIILDGWNIKDDYPW